jgi:hypothetical protein
MLPSQHLYDPPSLPCMSIELAVEQPLQNYNLQCAHCADGQITSRPSPISPHQLRQRSPGGQLVVLRQESPQIFWFETTVAPGLISSGIFVLSNVQTPESCGRAEETSKILRCHGFLVLSYLGVLTQDHDSGLNCKATEYFLHPNKLDTCCNWIHRS